MLKVKDYQAPAKGCKGLADGDKLLMDEEQMQSDRKRFVKSARRIYTQECSPFMTPVSSSSRTQVGAYLGQQIR
jgi:hypothetical protein